jgi:hypothetical protein
MVTLGGRLICPAAVRSVTKHAADRNHAGKATWTAYKDRGKITRTGIAARHPFIQANSLSRRRRTQAGVLPETGETQLGLAKSGACVFCMIKSWRVANGWWR